MRKAIKGLEVLESQEKEAFGNEKAVKRGVQEDLGKQSRNSRNGGARGSEALIDVGK